MTETATLPLSPDQLALLETGSRKEREDLIESLFNSLEENTTGRLLSGFCTGEREDYNDDPFVADVSFEDTLSGTITVDFTGSAYFGCKDMDRLDEHSEAVGFAVLKETKSITFTTNLPDPRERYPNEEF